MAKQKIGKITKEQLYTEMRKNSRDAEMDLYGSWTSKHKVHKSMKTYNRKDKHKTRC